MNVNPFSYLMNKISQKVSKSGDTMTGTLEINAPSASDFNLGKANTSTGRFFIFASQDSYRARLQRGTLTADRNFTFPDASGTLALKSDIFDSTNPFAFRGKMGYDVASTDFNDYTTGTYRNDGTNIFPYSNAPSSTADNGWLICFTDSRFYYQFWISTYLGSCMWRKRSNGTWGSWTAWNF